VDAETTGNVNKTLRKGRNRQEITENRRKKGDRKKKGMSLMAHPLFFHAWTVLARESGNLPPALALTG